MATTSYSVEEIEQIIENSLNDNVDMSDPSDMEEEGKGPVLTTITTGDWEPTAWAGVEKRIVNSRDVFGPNVPEVALTQYHGFNDTDHCRLPVPEIPKVYEPNKDGLSSLILANATGLKAMMFGDTGTGKTSLAEFFAAKLGRPFVRVVFDATTDDQKLYGSLEVKSVEGASETYFNKSDLSYSLDFPTVACMDEFSRANAEQTMLVNPLLDRYEVSVTSHDDSICQTIKADSDWFVCGTDNTNGTGDDMDLYNSANVLDEAIRNRFDIWARIPYPNQGTEMKIIDQLTDERMPNKEVINLAKFSQLCHKGYEERTLRTAFSVRNLIAICSLWERGIDLKTAVEMNFKSRVAKSEVSDVAETIRGIWG